MGNAEHMLARMQRLVMATRIVGKRNCEYPRSCGESGDASARRDAALGNTPAYAGESGDSGAHREAALGVPPIMRGKQR